MARRAGNALYVLSLALVLAYGAAASSSTYWSFAPLPLAQPWFYASGVVAGAIIALTFDETPAVFGHVVLMALMAGLIFGGMVLVTLTGVQSTPADLAALFVLQQALPRLFFILALSLAGAFFAMLWRMR